VLEGLCRQRFNIAADKVVQIWRITPGGAGGAQDYVFINYKICYKQAKNGCKDPSKPRVLNFGHVPGVSGFPGQPHFAYVSHIPLTMAGNVVELLNCAISSSVQQLCYNPIDSVRSVRLSILFSDSPAPECMIDDEGCPLTSTVLAP
jgi:hypothetical protein